ncbi:ABC transporter permease subunit [Neobacillus sp. PS3-34]|uniref:ABC transporter permease subunit n=1 Tax=Neobacillus sp. PS3-34 TaxID=3070678 RepID=UPI0027E0D045|nr:ABC transporter permease subunit [Neobacillus sp. PS3-34]WML47730.1 ABC transporter permease subunit [Neobacillus sp. PS3-34]
MNKLLRINYSFYIGFFLVAALLFFSIFGPILAPHSLTETLETHYSNGKIFAPPLDPFKTSEYPLGTDRWGYDLLSMVLNGIRYTVFISIAVTVLKMAVGTLIGIYIGTLKKVPSWLEAFENAWSYVPLFIILYFFLRPISFNSVLSPSQLITYFIIVTAAISIPSIISSVRQKSAELSKSVFIEASRTLGAGRNRIVWLHIFPQMKESLLIMFVLEVVYVITIMGQLALMNIFIGGTKMSLDPIIYNSITKELAGLVGQARGNVYGTFHVLLVPLFVLLLTTSSFSLLANGLKNRFQSNYQRTPWIKTGFEPKILPKRKQLGNDTKIWKPTGERLALLTLIVAFVAFGSYVYAERNANVGVKNFSQADYSINVKMNKAGVFHSKANIDVKNLSSKSWDDLVFYFIPNAFKKGHRYKNIKGFSEVEINSIKVDGKKANFTLKNDTLKVQLKKKMEKRDSSVVTVDYSFTIPEEGSRFSKIKDRYYLAQWYPMLATFEHGKWNKEDYLDGLETFVTGWSDFKVSYSFPKGYSIASTSDHDPGLKKNKGEFEADNVREVFIAAFKDMKKYETESNGVKIRLFTEGDHNKDPKKTLELAKSALSFYREKIGEYPHKQLDIVLDKGQNMEYPGIITVDPYGDDDAFFILAIVHEIAHQYFYGVVANDQYNEAWLDEGFTEFATNMYFYVKEKQSEYEAQILSYNRMDRAEQQGLGKQYSNVPLDKNQSTAYIYGQPAIQLFDMIQDNYTLKGKDLRTVDMQYLSDYYNHFKYKQVDTKEFLKFTMNYFELPSGYFTDWLDVQKANH